MLLVSSFLPIQDPAMVNMSSVESGTKAVATLNEVTNGSKIIEDKLLTSEEVELRVKNYFKNSPILIKIAECESRFRHYGKDGLVLRGTINSDDLGVMQINKRFHLQDSKKLGHDITTLEGNLAYAKEIYLKSGTKPWTHSSTCWNEYKGIALNK